MPSERQAPDGAPGAFAGWGSMIRSSRILRVAFAFLTLACGLFAFAYAQTAEEQEEKGRFVRFVEDQISSDNVRIRLNGLDGTLSSDVRLASITIADREGVWLTIRDAQMTWNRSALLRGKLDIERLAAEAIEVTRRPLPDEGLPDPEASGFKVPDLPVEIVIGDLAVPQVVLAAPVAGLAATLSVDGSLKLEDGALDTDLAIVRKDGPGGSLTLKAAYAGSGETIAIDLDLSEPEGGIIATLADLEGRPPVRLTVKGEGSIDDLTTDIGFLAGGRPIVAGQVVLRGEQDGRRVTADLGGPLAAILPERLRPFVGEDSRLRANLLLARDGTTLIEQASLRSGAIDLALNGRLLRDNFLAALNVEANLRDNDGSRITLDLSDRQVSMADARLWLRYDAAAREAWQGELTASDVRGPTLSARKVALSADGRVTNLDDPQSRTFTFSLDGAVDGIGAADRDVAGALGERITLTGSGRNEGTQPLRLNGFRIAGETVTATLDGVVDGATFKGDLALASSDLTAFAGLLDTDVAGSLDLAARGSVSAGPFDLTVRGETRDLAIGRAEIDGLLAGTTTLSGRAARGEGGLLFDGLVLSSDHARVALDGRFASAQADLTLEAVIRDLARATDRASGEARLEASVKGESRPFSVAARLSVPNGQLMARDTRDLTLAFDGTIGDARPADGGPVRTRIDGRLDAGGTFGGAPVDANALISAGPERQSVRDLVLSVGDSRIDGAAERADGLLDARLNIASRDISALAALALADAEGAVDGTVTLTSSGTAQDASARLRVESLRYERNRVGSATVTGAVADLFGRPRIGADFDARDISIAGFVVRLVDGQIETRDERTAFDVTAELAQADARVRTAGSLVNGAGRTELSLDRLEGTASGKAIRLRSPARLELKGGTTEFEELALEVGGGSIVASGSAGETLEIDATVDALPLDIANAVRPDLGLTGTVSGTARVRGTGAAPDVTFDVRADDVSAAQLARAGIAPVDATAKGRFAEDIVRLETARLTNSQGIEADVAGTVPLRGDGLNVSARLERLPLELANTVRPDLALSGTVTGTARATGSIARPQATFDIAARSVSAAPLRSQGVAALDLDAAGTYRGGTLRLDAARLSNGQGLAATAAGTVPIQSGGRIDIGVDLQRLPLTLANAVRPELGLDGTITGSARIGGTLAAPSATFSLSGQGVTAAALRAQAIQPLTLSASGSFGDGRVVLDAARASNAQGIDVTAEGSLPAGRGELALRARGAAPLSLAEGALAARGTRLSGAARFDVAVSGQPGAPGITGDLSVANATVTDPLSNLRLDGVTLEASFDGNRATIRTGRASLAAGGTVTLSGSVGLTGDMVADIAVLLDKARYTDGQTFTTLASGRLTLTGSLAADPLLAGMVTLERTEVVVPESFGGRDRLLDVRHVRPTPKISRTLARLDAATPVTRPTSRPSILNLDITIDAPARIFVRGRGLDAELGGSVRVRGPVTAVRPVGAFRLRRGRLAIIGRRFDLDEGTITLTGDLDPLLDFTVRVQADDVEAFIRLRGRASDLEVTFDSNPELPQDEVLARIIFGRSVTDLSPTQIARLIAIASDLTGNGSGGIVGNLRAATGLDELDVVTDAQGGAAVRAGRYVTDNVYLGVQAGAETEATINLDITENLKARGSVGTSGNSKIGIFFEKDY